MMWLLGWTYGIKDEQINIFLHILLTWTEDLN